MSRAAVAVAVVILAPAAGARAQDANAPAEPTAALSLADAVALAVAYSPELRAYASEIRAADARALQAGARPNPELSLSVENISGTLPGSAAAEVTLSLGQLLELGGDRGARVGAAAAERSVAERDLEARRAAVLAEVVVRYLTALAADELAALAAEARETAEEIAESVGNRVRAGASSRAELTRAEVEVARARLEKSLAEQDQAMSRALLASCWGESSARFPALSGALDRSMAVPELESLLERAEASPEVTRWDLEVLAGRQRLGVARAARVPDLEIGGGVRRLAESDDYTLVAGLTAPLPLFDRNRGGIREAEASVERAGASREQARAARRLEIIGAHGRITRSRLELAALREAVLPGAERALDEIEGGYREGRFGSLDLLDARRTLTAVRRDEIETLLDLHLTATEIERLVGGPLIPAGRPERGSP
ncbi:MAG: TolC family protein [Candidatus Eiseniibacteriota bacterium]